ncbi:MAG: tripartite tricarboxylate transporter TctB family protein [Cellvibrionaceae bacterium]|nr:tripartite tricarboxylate transporter TctB family protein [Motiliproteus sp.]MCW9052159.1 tripartite tricarboxylate transporter TctB family protein [Motiliproteus sp.]
MKNVEIDIAEIQERYYGRFNPNSILGATFALVAILFLYYLVPNYIEEPGYLKNPMLSPRFIPLVAGWLVLTLSIVMLIEGLLRPPKHTASEELHSGIPKLRWALMMAACAIYMFLFEQLGAITCGIFASLFLFLASSVRHVWVYLLGFAFPVVVSLLFIHVLNVPLPVGTIWE